jgi:hypothetical protein
MTNKAEVIMMFRDSPGAGKDLTAPAVKDNTRLHC